MATRTAPRTIGAAEVASICHISVSLARYRLLNGWIRVLAPPAAPRPRRRPDARAGPHDRREPQVHRPAAPAPLARDQTRPNRAGDPQRMSTMTIDPIEKKQLTLRDAVATGDNLTGRVWRTPPHLSPLSAEKPLGARREQQR
jgi:hypothetical protein